MEELDILTGVPGIGLLIKKDFYEMGKNFQSVIRNNNIAILCQKDSQSTLQFSAYPLTKIGKEMFSIINSIGNEKYLISIGEECKKQGVVSVQWCKILKMLPDGTFQPSDIKNI
jgi:hypothetical protein